MSRRTTSVLVTALLATLLGPALAAAAPSVASPSADDGGRPAPLRYVALGDSYSAASGVLPVDRSDPQCLRSTRNYPSVIAERTGARLVDVTCGAADTGDFFAEQYPGTAPQLDALTRRTRLVTLTIGGNDSNVFIGAILTCGSLGVLALGNGSPCRDQQGSTYVDTIRDQTFPDVVRALRAVHRRAPRAEVAILGYPWIVPQRKGCFPVLPIARGDVPYLRHLQRVLNDAVRRAAARTGSTYVDMDRVSDGHDACQPPGTRWIEPVVGTTNPVIVHPNALGERRMARQALRVLDLPRG